MSQSIIQFFQYKQIHEHQIINISELNQLFPQCDSDVIQQICQQLSQNYNQITPNSFSETTIEALKILRNKINQTKQMINEYQNKKQKLNNELSDTNENYNLNGICENSQLFIEIKSARFRQQIMEGMKNQVLQLFLYIKQNEKQCQQIYSNQFQVNDSLINNQFKFDINDSQQYLVIELFDNENRLLSNIQIEMKLLKDQEIREEWIDMMDIDLSKYFSGGVGNIGLFINVQWIHN